MAGIYSQGGSAGHRYAGWLETVEAKNFQFGGKVFNGSPSAIFVGSKMVWPSDWLTFAAVQAILGAFGQRDGMAVINATNAYLNGIAASDRDKAQQIADIMNSSATYAVGFGGMFYYSEPQEYIEVGSYQMINTGIVANSNICTYLDVSLDGNLIWIINAVSGTRYGLLNNAGYTSLRLHYGSYNNTNIMNKLTGRHTIELNLGVLSVDETQRASGQNTFSTSESIKIGQTGGGESSRNNLYAAKLWNGSTNEQLRELYPCKRKSDNALGVWDVISCEFIAAT